MLPKTHRYIADRALDQIKGRGIYLNETYFRVGNVAPDFSPYHKMIRHYKEDSLEYVEQSILELSNNIKNANNNMLKTDLISLKAGIICHYAADYFCYPHFNNIKFTESTLNIKDHINYEKELDEYIKYHKTEFISEYAFKSFNDLLEKNIGIYNNTKKTKNDINLALSTVINLLSNINRWSTSLVI